ncbi:MAG TPA: VCBS repeat-containing protein [Pirellulaceae bacterium]|nr:VCBS repeat-containing protein [Pirellulaceae bacterium]
MNSITIRLIPLSLACLIGSAASAEEPAKSIRFERTQLDAKFRSEGVAAGDFNKDGKMDIAAGFVWYEAPKDGGGEWKMHAITEKAPEHDPKGYSNSFCTWAEDLNGDGWTDIIVVDFPGTPTWWFENPKGGDKPWARHTITPVTNNESPMFTDVDGDGQRELVCAVAPDTASSDGPDRQMAYLKRTKDPYQPWTIHRISVKAAPGTTKYSHGLGVGDVNGDGKNDILVADGWWEAPAKEDGQPWAWHPAGFNRLAKHGGGFAQMYVFDIDGDGDSDVFGSSPHAFGTWWFEQTGKDQWQAHEIDMTFSQVHGVCLADMNGDGLPDIVCGKRWWAHAPREDGSGGDPGVNDPAVFYWLELKRTGGRVEWISRQFDHNSGPGTQFEIADISGDGLPDVIASNKKGVHLVVQVK